MRITPPSTPLEVGVGDSVHDTLDLYSATSVSGSSSSTSNNGAARSWRRRLQSVMSQFIWEIESGIAQNREIRVKRILLSDTHEGLFDQAVPDDSPPSTSEVEPDSADQNVAILTASVCTHVVSRPGYLDRSGDVCKPWQCKG